jgi:excisionase family DNA binding protein
MTQSVTAIGRQSSFPALAKPDSVALAAALASDPEDISVFVDGTSLRLPDAARDAVVDLLSRLADGEGVEIHAAHAWLTTAQAATLAGISQTYLRNLSDAGTIPVTYRGTHRRYRSADVLEWVKTHRGSENE